MLIFRARHRVAAGIAQTQLPTLRYIDINIIILLTDTRLLSTGSFEIDVDQKVGTQNRLPGNLVGGTQPSPISFGTPKQLNG